MHCKCPLPLFRVVSPSLRASCNTVSLPKCTYGNGGVKKVLFFQWPVVVVSDALFQYLQWEEYCGVLRVSRLD